MKFVGLNGKIYNKSLSKYIKKNPVGSVGHKQLGDELKKIFPNLTILREMTCFGTRLRLDFFIPSIKIAFEFDGKQHEEYSDFFHKSRINYAKSQLNDMKKHRWCDINNIVLIRIDKKKLDNLREIIYESTRSNKRNDNLDKK